MKLLKQPAHLASNLLLAAVFGVAIACITGLHPLVAIAAVFILGRLVARMPMPAGAYTISSLPDETLWPDGSDNMGSLRRLALYALHSEFEVYPAPADLSDATGVAQLAQIVGGGGANGTAPTFAASKGWKSYYVIEDTGMIDNTIQGELKGKSFVNGFKCSHPGGSQTVLGLLRYMLNCDLLLIGTDAEGLNRLVGSEHHPASIDTGSFTTTETAAGRKMTTWSTKANSTYPAPICEFNIEMEASA